MTLACGWPCGAQGTAASVILSLAVPANVLINAAVGSVLLVAVLALKQHVDQGRPKCQTQDMVSQIGVTFSVLSSLLCDEIISSQGHSFSGGCHTLPAMWSFWGRYHKPRFLLYTRALQTKGWRCFVQR